MTLNHFLNDQWILLQNYAWVKDSLLVHINYMYYYAYKTEEF